MKRAKKHVKMHARIPPSTPRNPVARSPLLGKGGAHGKSTGAKRRAAKMALAKLDRDGDPAP